VKALRLLFLLMISATLCDAQKESLTIGSGDMLHISVLESADLDQDVRVGDSGDAPLILVGDVRLSGLSPAKAAQIIAKKLVDGNYVLNPHVSVTVERFATKNVTVIGQVRTPGSYEIDTPRTILDVVALAGGLTDLADRKIVLERRDTKEQIEYFASNNATAALKEQPSVLPGDTVIVARVSFVYVLGDVGHPGAFAATTNDSRLSVLQAVALAGGTPPNAAPSAARLIRKGDDGTHIEIHLPLSAMQKGKSEDFQLQPDDIVYVPFSYLKNMAVNINALVAAAATASIYRF
jgi:polysaccharide export outer membrane protein